MEDRQCLKDLHGIIIHNVRSELEKKEMSLYKLAKDANIGYSILWKMLDPKKDATFSVKTLHRVASTLDMTVAEITKQKQNQ
ncbi:Cro/C1-type helix-turn-helix DNA-binding protein [Breznakia blatticola]|uniref:Cro/C1-type helix-turn-helix DNA-binding protein n=1 Tax=Breznakia blatticola TaxID=1754012 RepID=A0A4R7ZPS8_9FIRM|nr:helix-turn-helix domain-containing protein [Breznakia blatticola]TDW19929.1 Cro/C1-type helix-turn-helix DNA-binding protein [Breznakia blatticola]